MRLGLFMATQWPADAELKNEISNLCEKLNVFVTDVSLGIGSDESIGGRFLRAGPAYGGSCFPKDTRAIIDTADKFKSN